MMQKWIEYMHNAGEEEYLWLGGDHYGDWLASDAILCPEVREGATQTDLIASAFFGYSVSLMAKVSRALGKDATYYEDMFVKIKDAFQRIFMKDGLPVLYPKYDALSTTRPVKALTQTSLVLILKFKLYKDEAERAAIAKKLVEMIDENGGKMSTGFVGTPYILEVLTENGYTERAYDLLLQEQSPSWIFSVNRGATTIWEHWDGIKEDGSFWDHCKNSFNHYSYGSVFEWVYGLALGVRVCPDGAGYRKITIEPHPDRRLGFAWGRIDTRLGALEAKWSYQTEGIRYDYTIPEGCEAKVTLPDGRVMNLTAGNYTFVTEDK
jgi:alpha-L-rhamnosidase